MNYPANYTLEDALREHLGRFPNFKQLWYHLNLSFHPVLVMKVTRAAHAAGITGEMTLPECIEALGLEIVV